MASKVPVIGQGWDYQFEVAETNLASTLNEPGTSLSRRKPDDIRYINQPNRRPLDDHRKFTFTAESSQAADSSSPVVIVAGGGHNARQRPVDSRVAVVSSSRARSLSVNMPTRARLIDDHNRPVPARSALADQRLAQRCTPPRDTAQWPHHFFDAVVPGSRPDETEVCRRKSRNRLHQRRCVAQNSMAVVLAVVPAQARLVDRAQIERYARIFPALSSPVIATIGTPISARRQNANDLRLPAERQDEGDIVACTRPKSPIASSDEESGSASRRGNVAVSFVNQPCLPIHDKHAARVVESLPLAHLVAQSIREAKEARARTNDLPPAAVQRAGRGASRGQRPCRILDGFQTQFASTI
jgi:hypothetical protein